MTGIEIPVSDVYIEVCCNDCSGSLVAEVWQGKIIVSACETCLENARIEGREE